MTARRSEAALHLRALVHGSSCDCWAQLRSSVVLRFAVWVVPSGACDGMTYEQIEQAMPEEYNARQDDKFGYRYARTSFYAHLVLWAVPRTTSELRVQSNRLLMDVLGLRCRYPRGESYADVIHRLEPVIIELERQRHPVLIVGHQASKIPSVLSVLLHAVQSAVPSRMCQSLLPFSVLAVACLCRNLPDRSCPVVKRLVRSQRCSVVWSVSA